MSIFKREQMVSKGNTASRDVIKAFLGEETEFSGRLKFDGIVRIDGRFEGNIDSSDNLIVGETGKVVAEIKIGSIMVQGKIEGDIYATKKVQITGTGQVIGNIYTEALHIEDGAVIEGKISMAKEDRGSSDQIDSDDSKESLQEETVDLANKGELVD